MSRLPVPPAASKPVPLVDSVKLQAPSMSICAGAYAAGKEFAVKSEICMNIGELVKLTKVFANVVPEAARNRTSAMTFDPGGKVMFPPIFSPSCNPIVP